jgi:hypothetical protein
MTSSRHQAGTPSSTSNGSVEANQEVWEDGACAARSINTSGAAFSGVPQWSAQGEAGFFFDCGS